MRIIRGFLKGKRFATPPNFPSRPTTDFAKEGLFNVLEHSIDFDGMNVLDLCAGTGNIALEFISRGANKLTAVDANDRCVQYLKKNAKDLGIEAQFNVVKKDALLFCKLNDQKFDLIFADPPFHLTFHQDLVQSIFEKDMLNEDGLVIIEHGRQTDLSHLPQFEKMKTFGNVNFSFFVRL